LTAVVHSVDAADRIDAGKSLTVVVGGYTDLNTEIPVMSPFPSVVVVVSLYDSCFDSLNWNCSDVLDGMIMRCV
jgi:hypothetical protein